MKTYFIFGEGETEKCYFSALSEYLRDKNSISYKIEPFSYKQIGITNVKLIETKKIILKKIYQEYNGITEKDLLNIDSKIFIILDTDGVNGYTKYQINIIKNFFKNDKIFKILFSNIEFEYPNYKKGYSIVLKNIHRDIIKNGFYSLLPSNIKTLEKHHFGISNTHIKDMIPYTEVYEIFK